MKKQYLYTNNKNFKSKSYKCIGKMNEKKNTKERLKKIIKDVEKFKKNFEEARDYVVKTSLQVEFVSESINKVIWDGEYTKESLFRFGERPEILNNDLFKDQLEFLETELHGITDYSLRFLSRVKQTYGDYSYLSGDVSQSSMNIGTGAIGVHDFYREFKRVNPVASINIRNPEENPYRKKGKLEYRLDLINPNLSTRINEISKSISIISKMKHLNDTAHQMREFLSHFLQLCDPNNDVKNTSWVEFSKNGNIIQKSRAIYAIIGSKSSNANLNPIVEIANKYRKLYKNLNGLAHLREGLLTPKRNMMINTYYSQLLEYTEIILDLRDLYLKS